VSDPENVLVVVSVDHLDILSFIDDAYDELVLLVLFEGEHVQILQVELVQVLIEGVVRSHRSKNQPVRCPQSILIALSLRSLDNVDVGVGVGEVLVVDGLKVVAVEGPQSIKLTH